MKNPIKRLKNKINKSGKKPTMMYAAGVLYSESKDNKRKFKNGGRCNHK